MQRHDAPLWPHGQTESGGRVLAVNTGARAPRGGVTRQGVVLTTALPTFSHFEIVNKTSLSLLGTVLLRVRGTKDCWAAALPLHYLQDPSVAHGLNAGGPNLRLRKMRLVRQHSTEDLKIWIQGVLCNVAVWSLPASTHVSHVS
jgi:hypothetical protein